MSSAPLIQSDSDGQVQRGELMARVFPPVWTAFEEMDMTVARLQSPTGCVCVCACVCVFQIVGVS